jgi:RNA polymerase subunit RPABC4/transcription elongation factor Spt4
MHRKKLIAKLAIPALVIALISLVIILLQFPYRAAKFEKHKREFKSYFAKFSNANINDLRNIASSIRANLKADKSLQNIALSINQSTFNNSVINNIQSKYFVDRQKFDAAKKYLWMSDINGNFLFGIPKEEFQYMNESYDKYFEVIKNDGFFKSRNDFLTKLIDKNAEIDFSQFLRTDRNERFYNENNWRFYSEGDSWFLLQPTSTTFTVPVMDNNNNLIGNLYMKVDDKVNEKYYASQYELERNDLFSVLNVLFGILLGFSSAFLWFLLPTWVYTDAQERDVRNPGVWAFLALISLFFGLTIYLITRPTNYKTLVCPSCNGELNGTRAYCPHCGTDLSDNFCQQCHYPIKPEWQFCPNCRTETKAHYKAKNLQKID